MLPQVAEIQKFKRVDGGALVQVFVPGYDPHKRLGAKCEIRFDDGQKISAEQRRKIFALCRDIANHTGHDVEDLRRNILLIDFLMKHDIEWFSLSNVDMTTARLYIEHILEFCFEHDIPLAYETTQMAKEVGTYLFLCLVHRKCACCGEVAEIHHVDAVGMGRDRTKIDHSEHRLIALCRIHHDLAHREGWKTFSSKRHLDGIKVTSEMIRRIGL